jgi:hypothetical protein
VSTCRTEDTRQASQGMSWQVAIWATLRWPPAREPPTLQLLNVIPPSDTSGVAHPRAAVLGSAMDDVGVDPDHLLDSGCSALAKGLLPMRLN